MKGYLGAAAAKPSSIQLERQKHEFAALIYYSMNTFLGKDDSEGFAVAQTFYPENIDADQWAQAALDAGMTAMLITARHYDGFCCWQTETTDYSVKGSNWLGGEGDLVRLCAEAARKKSLAFGIYYPILNRREQRLGERELNELLLKQIDELTSGYGKLFEFMLDDSYAQELPVDYGAIYRLIRKNQPECAITHRGPDARALGNARGVTRKNEWSSVPACYSYGEDGSVPNSVKKRKIGVMETDLGSRAAVKKETEFVWSPCEAVIPMRPHLFYRKDDDYAAKTKDKLLDLYYRTVGGNCMLVLGLSPDKGGRLHDTDVQILASTGHDLNIIFGYNLLSEAKITASSQLSELYRAENAVSRDCSFWSPSSDDKTPQLIFEFAKEEVFDKVIVMENIKTGQKIEAFTVYCEKKGKWKKFAEGGAVGYKKICAVKPTQTKRIKIVFEKFRSTAEIEYIQVN